MPGDSGKNNNIQTDRKRFSLGFCLGLIICLIVLDQLLKYLVFRNPTDGFVVLPGLGLKPFLNYNFAFSLPLPLGLMYTFYSLAIIVIAWYLISRSKQMDKLTIIAWLMVAAGALSNFGERILTGYVKDYLFIFQGIFNLADFYILTAVLILLVSEHKQLRKNLQQ